MLFENTNKLESVQENETHKVFGTNYKQIT